MKKKQFFGLGVGLSSVIMIFVVLCLTAFAVLAYFCNEADEKFTEKKATSAIAYQKADSVAKEIYALVDEKAYDAAVEKKIISESSGFFDQINDMIKKELTDEDINIKEMKMTDKDNTYILYTVGMTDRSRLEVKLKIRLNDELRIQSDDRIEIDNWKVINDDVKYNEDSIHVWTR